MESTKTTRNSFEQGLNTDLAKTNIPANQYIDASHVTLSANGQFTALQNIKGTMDLASIIDSAGPETILGVYANRYSIFGIPNQQCLTIFAYNYSTSLFKILCYDISGNNVYELFEETAPIDYYNPDTVIDAVLYAESGIDILYFTDNHNEIRKLRCEIAFPYIPNALTDFDTSLQRRGALGLVTLQGLLSGGSLLNGSYQFAYQMVSPATNKYSRWSLLSNPIKIYNTEGGASTIARGGVGMSSDRKIILDISATSEEVAHYTHFRIGVIENIYTTIEESQLTAYAMPLELVSAYPAISGLSGWQYTVNASRVAGVVKIPVTDLTVDLLAFQTVKTLTVKYNKLLGGNIKYKALEYDNGTPFITNGDILMQTDNSHNPFSLQFFATQYPGYFRDEVYRFAISYFDEFGNFSSPIRLNLSVITDNQTANGDIKFPSRSLKLGSNRYTLFSPDNKIISLGLRLVNLNSHPTWAKGFVILRAKRYKNILWQSPFIPMMRVKGIGALGNYPASASEGNPAAAVAHADAQPMGPNQTFFPPNMFWPAPPRKIDINQAITGAGMAVKVAGEAYLTEEVTVDSGAFPLWTVYPTQTMYNTNDPYSFSASDKLQTVDACYVSLFAEVMDNAPYFGGTGREMKTSISGTFYALSDPKYYYDSGHSGLKAPLRTTAMAMTAYQDFPNFSAGGSINGVDVLKYENIQTGNLTWSQSPDVMKCGVVAPTLINGDGIYPITYASGFSFATSSVLETSYGEDDTFVFTNNATHADDLQIIEIVNCVKGLSDDRYGKATAQLEYIFTGTIYTFNSAELPTVEAGNSLPITVDVFGGDCITAPHTFKITDSVVSTTNQEKYMAVPAGQTIAQSIASWSRAYNTAGSVVLNIPIAFDGVSQFVEIVLESEHNGTVMDISPLVNITSSNSISVNGIKDLASVRIPLTYNYNINYSKENLDKIFVPIDVNIPKITSAPARLIFTDTKIYQSNIPGFDTFRTLSFYDLDETYGGITKLAQAGDETYALQDRAIVYIPIGTKVLEAAEAGAISVTSGDYINQPIYVSVKRGCQNRGAVVETGDSIFFPDVFNKSIYQISNKNLKSLSDQRISSTVRELFDSTLAASNEERALRGFYDPYKGEYWLYNNNWTSFMSGFCYVYNEKFDCWVCHLDTTDTPVYGAVTINDNVYLLGKDFRAENPYLNKIWAYSMYTGFQMFMGKTKQASVTFVVNPDVEAGKTFDNLVFNSSDRLSGYTGTVDNEFSLVGPVQQVMGDGLDIDPRDGTYRVKALRDVYTGNRVRGKYMSVQINWQATKFFPPVSNLFTPTTLSSVLTKYRISQRQP